MSSHVSTAGGAGPAARARGGQAVAWLALTAVLVLASLPLVRGEVSAVRDGMRFFLPYFGLIGDFARDGRLLVWNPFSGAGVPEFAEPQVGSLSPFTVLVAWLTGGSEAGFRVYWLLVWWLGGAGVLLLARHLRAPWWGGLVVAVGFLACGQYTCGGPWISHLLTASALPFVVWRADAALRGGGWLAALQAGALWGLSALGGYPGLTICTGAFLALWGAGRWLAEPKGGARAAGLARTLLVLAVVCATGILVLAPTYAGFLHELTGYALRTGELSREAAVADNALAPGALATLASPHLAVLRSRAGESLWPGTWLESCSAYLGPAIPLLALWALVSRPSRWRLWLALVTVLAFATAVGQSLPLRGWLYDWVPPFRYFRHASIVRLYGMFGLAVLALVATRDAAAPRGDEEARPRTDAPPRADARRRVLVALLLPFAAFLALWTTWRAALRGGVAPGAQALASAGERWLALAQLATGWGTAALALVLLGRARGRKAAPLLLVAVALADGAATIRLSLPLVSAAEPASFWRRVEADHSGASDLTERGLRRVFEPDYLDARIASHNEHLSPKIPALDAYSATWSATLGLFVTVPELAAMATGEERLWFSPEAPRVAPSLANALAYAAHLQGGAAPKLVLHERSSLLARAEPERAEDLAALLPGLAPAARLGAAVSRYAPTELAFEVDCPADGWLLVTDRWARGWTASVDSRPVPVLAGVFLFRAIPVHAGRNAVRFRYAPPWLPPLVALCWSVVAAVGIASLVAAWRARARARRRERRAVGLAGS